MPCAANMDFDAPPSPLFPCARHARIDDITIPMLSCAIRYTSSIRLSGESAAPPWSGKRRSMSRECLTMLHRKPREPSDIDSGVLGSVPEFFVSSPSLLTNRGVKMHGIGVILACRCASTVCTCAAQRLLSGIKPLGNLPTTTACRSCSHCLGFLLFLVKTVFLGGR